MEFLIVIYDPFILLVAWSPLSDSNIGIHKPVFMRSKRKWMKKYWPKIIADELTKDRTRWTYLELVDKIGDDLKWLGIYDKGVRYLNMPGGVKDVGGFFAANNGKKKLLSFVMIWKHCYVIMTDSKLLIVDVATSSIIYTATLSYLYSGKFESPVSRISGDFLYFLVDSSWRIPVINSTKQSKNEKNIISDNEDSSLESNSNNDESSSSSSQPSNQSIRSIDVEIRQNDMNNVGSSRLVPNDLMANEEKPIDQLRSANKNITEQGCLNKDTRVNIPKRLPNLIIRQEPTDKPPNITKTAEVNKEFSSESIDELPAQKNNKRLSWEQYDFSFSHSIPRTQKVCASLVNASLVSDVGTFTSNESFHSDSSDCQEEYKLARINLSFVIQEDLQNVHLIEELAKNVVDFDICPKKPQNYSHLNKTGHLYMNNGMLASIHHNTPNAGRPTTHANIIAVDHGHVAVGIFDGGCKMYEGNIREAWYIDLRSKTGDMLHVYKFDSLANADNEIYRLEFIRLRKVVYLMACMIRGQLSLFVVYREKLVPVFVCLNHDGLDNEVTFCTTVKINEKRTDIVLCRDGSDLTRLPIMI